MRAVTTLVLLLLLPVVHGMAQNGAGIPLVTEIIYQNTGSGQLDKSYIDAHIKLASGQPFDRMRLASDVQALLDTGRFSDVRADIEQTEDGFRLFFLLKKRYRLDSAVKITGAQHFRETTLREELGLHPGDLVDEYVMAGKVRVIRSKYRKAMYPDVKFSWTIEETDARNGLAAITLEIDEGERYRIGRVMFPGNLTAPRSVLRKITGRPALWNPLRLFKRLRYDPNYLAEIRSRLNQYYVDEGYLDVVVGAGEVRSAGRSGRVDIVFPVVQGPLYHIGMVELSGMEIFPREDLAETFNLARGDVAGMSRIDQVKQALRDYYGSRGYLETRVRSVMTRKPDTATIDVLYEIEEGQLSYIRNIRIKNNIRTRDKVIRRELLVYPGDIYDEVRVRTSERRIRNLGFFSDVRSYSERTGEEQWRDLVLSVEEQRTGQFMMGAGFSSIDKLMGFVELSLGNFDLTGWPYLQGGGQKLKLRASVGSTRSDYELSFVEPWFMDRQLAFGIDLYRNEVDYSDYDVKRIGGALSLSRPLPGPNRVRLRYRLESSRIRDIADTNRYVYVDAPDDEYYFTKEEDNVSSSLELSLNHDSRDHPFIATRGLRAGLSAELTGGPLGADMDIYRLTANASRYFPVWRGHVLSFRLRYEVVDSFGRADDVPLSERLFAGGGRTLRGFKYRDVGPKVIRHRTGGDPFEPGAPVVFRAVGGQTLAVANIEYTVPVVSGVRLAGFYDIGNVWSDPYDFDSSGLAESAGVGIRFDLPGFPIRIDRAWIIGRPDDYARADRWVFWIGHDF